MSYVQIIQQLPQELQMPMVELVDAVKASMREELAVRRQDIEAFTAAQNRAEQRLSEVETIVAELARAQKQAEQRVGRLETALTELAEAQKRTEQKVEELAEAQRQTEQRVGRLETALTELAEAQKRTEQKVEELAEAQKRTEQELQSLAKGLKETRSTLGGLSQSVAYALENEAYRMLPGLLQEKYGITVTERLVRTEIGGEEINLFGRGRRNGHEVLIVGESKMRLDERRQSRRGQKAVFSQLKSKVEAVKTAFPGMEIVPLIVTHYARPQAVAQAQEQGIIIIQSFEW